MALTQTNIGAAGPHIYLAAIGTVLPEINNLSGAIDYDTNEVQTVTITGTPAGGDFTLEVVYPDNTSETTAAIAYNATAADVKTALAALSKLDAADLITSGGALPGTAVVVTFTGTYANTDMPMMIGDPTGLTGGTDEAVTVTETTKGRLWSETLISVDEVTVKFSEETEEIIPVYQLRPEYVVRLKGGVSEITTPFAERDVDALAVALGISKTTATAGASQTGQDILTDDGASITYYQMLMSLPGLASSSYFYVWHFPKVRPRWDMEVKFGGGVTKPSITWDVYSDSDGKTFKIYEQTAAKTS